MEEKLRSLTEF